jgi:hypothetical protein
VVGLAAALSLGCNEPNSGRFTGDVVGPVSNTAGTCVSATNPELQSAPNLVCLDQHIAREGDCVEIMASTPAVNDSKPLLFAGSLEAVLPHRRCSAARHGG